MKLLDRSYARRVVHRQFGRELDLFSELIDVGVDLLSTAPETRLLACTEMVVYGFLRRATVVFDTINELLRAGQSLGARPLLRTAIELSWQLEWLLNQDTDRRAARFHVATLRTRLSVASAALMRARNRNRILQASGWGGMPNPGARYAARINEVNSKFHSNSHLQSINAEFEAERLSRNLRRDPYWFSINNGPRSYAQLAQQLGRQDVYEGDYARLSEIVHSSNLDWDIFGTEDSGWDVTPIREIDRVPFVMSAAYDEAQRLFSRIIEYTHPTLLLGFDRLLYRHSEAFDEIHRL